MAKTQKRLILEWLQMGRDLTPLDALENFGCFRLAASIGELRDDGHTINDRRKAGKHSIYYMDCQPAGLDT